MESSTDPSTGAIIFPYDRFYATLQEQDVLAVATSLAIAECAQAQGVNFQASATGSYSTLYDASGYFGVWTEDLANRFGFVVPMTDRDMEANGVVREGRSAGSSTATNSAEQPDTSELRKVGDSNARLSDEEREVVADCSEGDLAAEFDLRDLAPAGPWTDSFNAIQRGFHSDDEVTRVYGEYHACLEQAGLQSDPEAPDLAMGADVWTISGEQIALALAVVDCKKSVGFVPRLASIMAARQAPVIDEHAPELLEQRHRVDAALAAARTLIAENSDE